VDPIRHPVDAELEPCGAGPRELRLAATALPAAVARCRSQVRAFAVRHGVRAGDDVELAVSEAVTNAVLHAYAGAEPGEVRVFAERVGQRVVIVVEDDGAGLSPRADSPGLGLGLMVISEVALDFHVGAGERGVGTRVELSFAVAG